MPQGQLVAAGRPGQAVQGPPAELAAQAAGILFPADLEQDLPDVGPLDPQGNFKFPAPGPEGGDLLLPEPQTHVHGEGVKLEGLGRKPPEGGQKIEQGQTVLAPRKADGNAVSGLDQIKVGDGPPEGGEHLLGGHKKILSV